MATEAIDYRRHVRRPIGFVVLGVVLLGIAGYLSYDAVQRRTTNEPTAAVYTYSVKQSVDKTVEYFPSSFYENTPGKNDAYVMSLTNKVKMAFHYAFSGSTEQPLAYVYEIRAVVRGKYALKGNEDQMSNVWSKEFQLLAPVHGTTTTKDLAFSPSVEVPYDEYRKMVEQLRTSLALPVGSDVTVTFTINVAGTVDGTPFNDLKTMVVTIPVEQQIYTISEKYDKDDTKQVTTASQQKAVDTRAQYETYVAFGLIALAVASFVYGLRKQIFKTPYQRELDKIYRLHDGIIVRASKPADLTGKRLVAVRSFDDMLNLEEELKLPIVATSLSAEATRFMIIRDDVVYAYTLGHVHAPAQGRSLEEIANSVNGKTTVPKQSARQRKVQ